MIDCDNLIEVIEIIWLAIVTGYLLSTLRRIKMMRDEHGPSKPI